MGISVNLISMSCSWFTYYRTGDVRGNSASELLGFVPDVTTFFSQHQVWSLDTKLSPFHCLLPLRNTTWTSS